MPRGRATLALEAGAWIVATATPRANGRLVVKARLVEVPARRKVNVETGTGRGPTIAAGAIQFSRPSGANFGVARIFTTVMTQVGAQKPCTPKVVPPGGNASRDPVWKAILGAARSAAKSGPARHRAAATAAAASLTSGAVPSVTVSGNVDNPSGGNNWTGVFRATDASGQVVFTQSYSGFPDAEGMFKKVLGDIVDDLCAQRRRIQVDITYTMEVYDSYAKATGTAVLSAVGKERVGADGKIETGAYEFDGPQRFQTTLSTIEGPGCPTTSASLVEPPFPPFDRPTALAVEPPHTSPSGPLGSVALKVFVPAVQTHVLYTRPNPPCAGRTGVLPLGIATAPGVIVDLGATDADVTASGTRTIGNATGSYELTVTARRLPAAK